MYLLPAAFFAAVDFWLAKIFHLLPAWLGKQVDLVVTSPNNAVTLTAIYTVVTFLLAILLRTQSSDNTHLGRILATL